MHYALKYMQLLRNILSALIDRKVIVGENKINIRLLALNQKRLN